jgi:hypothetical protein
MKFKEYINKLSEAVIKPGKIDFGSTDVTTLNYWYEDDGFEFEEVDSNEKMTAGYDPQTGIINVRVPEGYTDLKMMNALIGHEMIHKVQDKLSKGKMGKQAIKNIKKLRELEKQKEKETDPKRKSELEKKIINLDADIRYRNQEELMAYAYMVTKLRKEYNMRSSKDVYDYLSAWLDITNKKHLKKLKNYTKQYWKFKDEL